MPGCVIVGGVARGPAQVQGGDGEGTHSTGVPQPGQGLLSWHWRLLG